MSNHLSETADKFELHTRLQLSQLIDSELPMDEARFLLRRLQHNEELANCQERWQLYGDVLRGVALAPPRQTLRYGYKLQWRRKQHLYALNTAGAVGPR